jgi:hypothetical protein
MADEVVLTPLITIATLAVAARKDAAKLALKPYAHYVVEQASATVCDTAEHPEWETAGGAPRKARSICMQIAVRALLNPELEVAYTTGPLSGRNRDEWAFGFEPTPYEREQLEEMQGGPGGSLGLWVQPIDGGIQDIRGVILKRDPWDQAIEYQNTGDVGTGYSDETVV